MDNSESLMLDKIANQIYLQNGPERALLMDNCDLGLSSIDNVDFSVHALDTATQVSRGRQFKAVCR
jgi:hypothetical protein